MIPSHTPTVGSVYLTTPPLSWITTFPPPSDPAALAPPHSDSTFAHPFNIDPILYNDLLHVAWPATFAIVYACAVTALNRLNRQREYKPWAITRSSLFYAFVLLHNIALAAFSIWTCAGMINAVKQTWPGFEGEGRWAEVADAFCKMNGPRGMGSAATFNGTTGNWGIADHTMKLLDASPDSTDVGRLWNEGLAFYGWVFYVSKFYEVVDTLIILSKGKTSSILQTFHHAGAMLCMWAGIRYMSPPIWMFVTLNSGLHGLMYAYYALSTLDIHTPQVLKRVLTFLQITQFVIGASYALAHLFVAYSRPVSAPYLFIHNLSTALPTAASSVSSAFTSATATANLGSWLKKAALRAAGEEGLAGNVRNAQGEHFGIDAIHAAEVEKAQEEMRWRSEYQTTDCLDTPGQVFAILLNALYLAPLTILFLRFFANRYLTGTKQNVPPETKSHVAKESAKDAIHDLETEIKEAMNSEQHADEGTPIPPEVASKISSAKKQLKAAKAQLDGASQQPREKASDMAEETSKKAKTAAEQAQQKAGDMAKMAKDEMQKDIDAIRKRAQGVKKEGEEKANDKAPEAKATADDVKDEAKDTTNDEKDEAAETKDAAKDTAGKKADEAKRPSSKSNKSRIPKRDPSPVKRDPSPVKKEAETNGEKPAGKENEKTNGEGEKKDDEGTNGLDESAYEVNPDEIKSEEEEKAEKEMQPGSS